MSEIRDHQRAPVQYGGMIWDLMQSEGKLSERERLKRALIMLAMLVVELELTDRAMVLPEYAKTKLESAFQDDVNRAEKG